MNPRNNAFWRRKERVIKMHYAFSDRFVLCVFRFVKPVKSSYRTRLWRRDFHESNSPVDYNRIVPRATTVRGLTLYLSCYLDGIAWRRNRITSEIRAVSRQKNALRKSLDCCRRFHRVSDDVKDRLTDVEKDAGFVFQDPRMKKKGMGPRELIRCFFSYRNYGNSVGRRLKITSHSLMQHTYST